MWLVRLPLHAGRSVRTICNTEMPVMERWSKGRNQERGAAMRKNSTHECERSDIKPWVHASARKDKKKEQIHLLLVNLVQEQVDVNFD